MTALEVLRLAAVAWASLNLAAFVVLVLASRPAPWHRDPEPR